MVGLERFQCDCRITKILEANLVEVVAPDIDVQVLGPIVLHPPVNHRAAGDEFLDAVGAIAERRLERGCADVALLARRVASFPPVLGQDPELPEDHRHFPIAGGIERESDLALAALLNPRDVPVKGADIGVVFLVGLEGVDHVLDRNRLAVVVAGGGAQAKGGGRKVRGVTDRFRDQSVMGRRFVERRRHQRVANRAGSRSQQALEPGHDLVEVVERAERHQAYRPSFRRLRIDVVEMPEAGRISEVAEQRQTVPPLRIGALRARRCCRPWRLAKQGGDGGKGAGAKDRATGEAQVKPPGSQALSRLSDELCPVLIGPPADERR